MKKQLLCLIIFLFLFFTKSFAGVGSAIASGNWSSASTWLIDGIARIPAGGDLINIPNGITVVVNGNPITITGAPVYLYIHGVLEFPSGRKLWLPCNSYCYVYP